MCLVKSNAKTEGDGAGFHLTLYQQGDAVKNSYKQNTHVSSYLPHTKKKNKKNPPRFLPLKNMQHFCEDKYILKLHCWWCKIAICVWHCDVVHLLCLDSFEGFCGLVWCRFQKRLTL